VSSLRYVLFAAVGVVVAAVIFIGLNFLVSASRDAQTGLIERWIIRAACETYELTGTVRDPKGAPIAFAIVEAAYLDARLVTRSGPDGRFRVLADTPVCDRQPPRSAAITVVADNHRPTRQVLPFEQTSLDVVLQPVAF
jgi:hypothetical protein